jgi:voltage-gated potassium channel
MNKEEHDEYHRRLLYIFSIMAVLFFGGSFFYHNVEGWTFLDSMYFSATTMTTVGYGDLAPKTQTGRFFTIFYLFASVGIAIYGLSLFAAHFVEVREDHWVERLDRVSSAKKHAKNFHESVKKLFGRDSKELTEQDKPK